jgi:excisionase family DNA binding protein
MSQRNSHSHTDLTITNSRPLITAVVDPQSRGDVNTPTSPSSQDIRRLLERRHAQELGVELPLNTEEAAAYIGMHPNTVDRMARAGEIPANLVSGVHGKKWSFYPSELDVWLRNLVNSHCFPQVA